uniref:Uncharacterized protein n=1 Tax=Caenorhabditis japonica TaxID=281687 RepID=A0A8R1DTD1_CAEJA
MQSRPIANLVPKRYSFIPNSFIPKQFYSDQFYSEQFYFATVQFHYSSIPKRVQFRYSSITRQFYSEFAEQYNAVLPGTLSSIAWAGFAVVIVSLILIPEPVASLWVSFSIVSINVGILGFMTFWSVRLDFISMVTIVMSIGFCVDFAAHLAYNFSKEENIDAAERLRNALYAVGPAILMSASSTILGVSFMASAESYVFRSFLKTIILVILLGALHGLVILPVLLSMFYCGGSSKDVKEHMSVVEQKLHAQYANPARTASIQYLSNPDMYSMPPPSAEYSLSSLEYNRPQATTSSRPLGAPPPLSASPKRELAGSSGPPEYEEHDPAGLSTFGVGPAVAANTTGLIPMRAKLKYPTAMTTTTQRRESEPGGAPDLYYPS